jgi:hypothetical protein
LGTESTGGVLNNFSPKRNNFFSHLGRSFPVGLKFYSSPGIALEISRMPQEGWEREGHREAG